MRPFIDLVEFRVMLFLLSGRLYTPRAIARRDVISVFYAVESHAQHKVIWLISIQFVESAFHIIR